MTDGFTFIITLLSTYIDIYIYSYKSYIISKLIILN